MPRFHYPPARVALAELPALPRLLQSARAYAVEIRIREAELAQHGFKVSLSKNERYPAITVGPFYSYEKAADQEQQVGVGISLPLPLWDRNAGNIETSKAREQQAQAALLATQRDVERRVAEAQPPFKPNARRSTSGKRRPCKNSATPLNPPIEIIASGLFRSRSTSKPKSSISK